MDKSFVDRRTEQRHESPDFDIEVWITGIFMPGGMCNYSVYVEGEDDCDVAADILERAAEVLRDE